MRFDLRRNAARQETWNDAFLRGLADHLADGMAQREGWGRKNLYEECPIWITPGERITGRLDLALAREPVVCQYSAYHLNRPCLEALLADPERRDGVARRMERVSPLLLENRLAAAYTDEETAMQASGAGRCNHFNGHMVMDYGKLLRLGLDGLAREVAVQGGRPGADPDFYRGLALTLEGMSAFIRRHGDMAAALLTAGAAEPELVELRDNCYCVAHRPPETFLQGLVLLWFGMQFADYDSFGRLDQYLWPLYCRDRERGVSRAELGEQLAHLWRKVDENGSIINMTLGGLDAEGGEAANELTYLALEVTRSLHTKGPNLCLRISAEGAEALWHAAFETLATGVSLPALYNDALIIPMLREYGIDEKDARDYCLAGCSQAMIPGKANFACDMGEYDALKCLELALHDGFDPIQGRQVGPHTGTPEALRDYQALRAAYDAQMRNAVRVGVALNDKDHLIRRDTITSTVRSLLTDDCLERGAGIFHAARYHGIEGEVVGLTNAANSLMAVKRLVYEERAMDLPELVRILDEDFADNEELRLRLLGYPKFGNDDGEVDGIRRDITRDLYGELAAHDAPLGGKHWPGEVVFLYHIDHGQLNGASPDGRHRGMPVADSCGAQQGTDRRGPTALLRSALCIPHGMLCTSCNLNLRFTRSLFAAQEEAVLALWRGYFAGGGYQMQVNVTEREELLDAIAHPEAHRGLVVRVGGYSAYFTQLTPELQADVLSRTEHGV